MAPDQCETFTPLSLYLQALAGAPDTRSTSQPLFLAAALTDTRNCLYRIIYMTYGPGPPLYVHVHSVGYALRRRGSEETQDQSNQETTFEWPFTSLIHKSACKPVANRPCIKTANGQSDATTPRQLRAEPSPDR